MEKDFVEGIVNDDGKSMELRVVQKATHDNPNIVTFTPFITPECAARDHALRPVPAGGTDAVTADHTPSGEACKQGSLMEESRQFFLGCKLRRWHWTSRQP